ncbi:class I SAM-dependent methyltransferase [Streptomyces odontomachi]|uniref:class I SAM-dependent methyltransferase n=1 Tax=Streptomyces odontomachi TaxID=2944940 RepID=UPI00210BB01D|nr:methyltransferase domain-containing protein [Streptomyces sp. ODS25]
MTPPGDAAVLPESAAAGPALPDGDAGRSYLPGMTLDDYVRDVVAPDALLRSVLDFGRPGSRDVLSALASKVNEFDDDDTGRGDSYRRAQRDATVRWTGMRRMLRLCAPTAATRESVVLDVLGGDGTVARAVAVQDDASLPGLTLLTGDVSARMIAQALGHGLPAVRQPADFLFLRDASVDAVLLAYGSHHISPRDRPAAVREALRVVRPGGRVVLHDFHRASPMARFFSAVVHPHTEAGHDYAHFSRSEMTGLFAGAGVPAQVEDLYDPLVVAGATEGEARRRLCDYVGAMYGVGHVLGTQEGTDGAWRLLQDVFDHGEYVAQHAVDPTLPRTPAVRPARHGWLAELPRWALVAVARKAV